MLDLKLQQLRTQDDRIIVYQQYDLLSDQQDISIKDQRWIKVLDHSEIESEEDRRSESRWPMKMLPNLRGYHAVFVPSPMPALIFKEASSMPHLLKLNDAGTVDLESFQNPEYESACLTTHKNVSFDCGYMRHG